MDAQSTTFARNPSSLAYTDSHTAPAPSNPLGARTTPAQNKIPTRLDPSAAERPPLATQRAVSLPIPAETSQQRRARPLSAQAPTSVMSVAPQMKAARAEELTVER